jgi:hypothetical protein
MKDACAFQPAGITGPGDSNRVSYDQSRWSIRKDVLPAGTTISFHEFDEVFYILFGGLLVVLLDDLHFVAMRRPFMILQQRAIQSNWMLWTRINYLYTALTSRHFPHLDDDDKA